MEIFWGNDCIASERLSRSVVTIGNFDGCHIGHREIFRRTIEHARRVQGVSVVYTFNPHPASVTSGGTTQLIYSMEEKIAEIQAAGMDYLVVAPFTREFANTPPQRFIGDIIIGKVKAQGVVVGHDFCFGRQAAGDINFLKQTGERLGFFVDAVPAVVKEGLVVSSTCVRGMIRAGDVRGAAHLLPHPFRIHGPVVHGMSRGRTLGFPTANVRPDNDLLPAYGVYAVNVFMGDGRYPGVANIGNNPTFDDEGTSLEVFIFDFQGDIYGNELTVEFIDRIRDEVRFQDKDLLIAQIRKDCADAHSILSRP